MRTPSPLPADIFRDLRTLSERVRRLEITSRAHTETKTFIVGGDLAEGLFIPWVFFGVNIDGRSPEIKQLLGLNGRVRVGELEVNWELDDVEIYGGHIIGAAASPIDFRDEAMDPIILTPGWHTLRPVIQSGTGTDLSAAYSTATGRR